MKKELIMENFTPEEDDLINQLRNRFMNDDLTTEKLKDDWFFYTFLKARNFNVQNAERMLRKSLDFRKSAQIENILVNYEAPWVIRKYTPQSLLGVDKEGCPIRYCPIGAMDTKGIFRVANSSDLFRYIVQAIEFDMIILKYQSKKLGRPVRQCIYLYDLKDFTLAKALHIKSAELFAKGATIFLDNYPELLKHIFVINASIYFTAVFPIVKAVLTGSILDKLHIFGHDGWKEELLKHVDANVLPAFLGGNKTDPDGNPMCHSFLKHGMMIPREYHLTKEPEKMLANPGCQTALISARQKLHVPVFVPEAGYILKWEFLIVNSGEVGFGLAYRSGTDDIEYLMPAFRIETEYTPEAGFFCCEKAGEYIIIADNTHSWINSKEVLYRLTVVSPEDHEKEIKLKEFKDKGSHGQNEFMD